jgi:hypothetical protein
MLARTLALLLIAGSTSAIAQNNTLGDPPARAAAASPKAPDALPIQKITLYRSGVGYFQRGGAITDTQSVQLKFDVGQINDVLKTLQVLDLSGQGRVDTVSYASKDPLARRLASFSVPIADNPSMPELLSRLRGSGVILKTIDGIVSGTVLSVETRKLPQGTGDKAIVVDTPVVNLVTDAGIRSVPVGAIMTLNVKDDKLEDEMNRALAAMADSRAERTKTVDLKLSGPGERNVVVAYVHETPVWKTSYRIVLGDSEPAKGAKGQAQLQGWAHVENTTDNDWTNVRLALVSGRPVSFKMDLYEPMYVWRPDVAVPTVAGVMPKEYAGAIGDAKPVAPGAPSPSSAGSNRPSARATESPTFAGVRNEMRAMDMAKAKSDKDQSGRYGEIPATITGGDMSDYAPKSVAKGGEVGEQFQYELAAPVTIERQRSAMIPIITANVDARRVSIYNRNDRADHPMRGVELVNSSGGQLLPGPLAVFDGAAYAGDAQIGQVSIGDKRLLAYALDLDVAVKAESTSDSKLMKLKIVDGTLEQTFTTQNSTKYTFDNKDLKRGRTIVLEHDKLDGWELKGDKARETTANLYRYDLPVDAGKAITYTVTQERTDMTRVGIFDYQLPTILQLQKEGKVSAGVLAALSEAGKRQTAVNNLERQIEQIDRDMTTAKADLDQATTMMNRIDRNNENYATLNKRLKDRLAKVEQLEGQRSTVIDQLNAARTSLNDYLRNLNAE